MQKKVRFLTLLGFDFWHTSRSSRALWRGTTFLHVPTLTLSFEALNATFFDRLDVFSNAIDLKNTLVALVLRPATSKGVLAPPIARQKFLAPLGLTSPDSASRIAPAHHMNWVMSSPVASLWWKLRRVFFQNAGPV